MQERAAGSGGAESRVERERPGTACEFCSFRNACQFLHLSELVRSEFADQLGTLRDLECCGGLRCAGPVMCLGRVGKVFDDMPESL